MPLVDYQSTGRPLIEIDLDLPPFERWRETGTTHAKTLRRFLADVEATAARMVKAYAKGKVPSSLSALVGKKAADYLIAKSFSVSGKTLLNFASLFGAEYQEEI